MQYLAEHQLAEVTAADDIDAHEILVSLHYPGLRLNVERWQSVLADPGAPALAREIAQEQVSRWKALALHITSVSEPDSETATRAFSACAAGIQEYVDRVTVLTHTLFHGDAIARIVYARMAERMQQSGQAVVAAADLTDGLPARDLDEKLALLMQWGLVEDAGPGLYRFAQVVHVLPE